MVFDGIPAMKLWLIQLVYQILLIIFVMIDLIKWLVSITRFSLPKAIRPAQDKQKRDWLWAQKYGLSSKHKPNENASSRIMLHCASMGEVVAATPVITAILENNPDVQIVVTTNTLTGKQQLERTYQQQMTCSNPQIIHQYLVVDFAFLTTRLIRFWQINVLLIMEVELWPNLIIQAKKCGVKTSIINARLTEKTAKGYQKLSWLSHPMLASIDHIFARNQQDYDNYLSLGVTQERLSIAGNVKFDIQIPEQNPVKVLREQMAITERQVVLIGSSHDGEEALALQMYAQLKKNYPALLLVIVPRHPHRFDVVEQLLSMSSMSYQRYSQQHHVEPKTDVLIVDVMGQLSTLYGVADIVMVGGSYANKGGHNPIEAAAFAKPILMGPHFHNNPELVNTLQQAGGLIVFDTEIQFNENVKCWLDDPVLRQQVGHNGLTCIQRNQGAVRQIVNYVTEQCTAR